MMKSEFKVTKREDEGSKGGEKREKTYETVILEKRPERPKRF